MNNSQVTRRDVLKAGVSVAAAATAPYAITSSALGNALKAPASDRVAVGHIGVGNRGRGFIRAINSHPDAQSVAISDCYQDRREGMAKVCKGTAYQDFRDLLARDDIDAVVVATPDHWHVPIAILAARAGKSAYVEKPLGLTLSQDLACQREFTKSGTVFQYGTQQRSMSHCHVACEQVRRGAIGKVHSIIVEAPNGGSGGSATKATVPKGLDYEMWLGPAPTTPYAVDRCKPPGSYWIYDQSIGYLGGWGAHPLDLMVWGSDADLSGPIVVEGSGVVPTGGLYNTVIDWDMQIKLGDVDFHFKAGTELTRFIGSDGWIQVARDRNRTMASDPKLLSETPDPEQNKLIVSKSHHGNFIEAVKKGDPKSAVSNLTDAVRSDIISHLCDISVRTGERISWDPKRQQLIDPSDQATAMLTRAMREPWVI